MKRKTQYSPVRSTIVYGALGAAAVYIISMLRPFAISAHVSAYGGWLLIAGYGYLLAKWEGQTPARLLFPLTLSLSATILSSWTSGMLIFPSQLLTLSWIRSDILLAKRRLRILILETLLCFGGALSATTLTTNTRGGTAIAIWIFFLVQSLYFPLRIRKTEIKTENTSDPFEQAGRRIELILSNQA